MTRASPLFGNVPHGKLQLAVVAGPGALKPRVAAVPPQRRVVRPARLGERRDVDGIPVGAPGVVHPHADGAGGRAQRSDALGPVFGGHGRGAHVDGQRQNPGGGRAGHPRRLDAAVAGGDAFGGIHPAGALVGGPSPSRAADGPAEVVPNLENDSVPRALARLGRAEDERGWGNGGHPERFTTGRSGSRRSAAASETGKNAESQCGGGA